MMHTSARATHLRRVLVSGTARLVSKQKLTTLTKNHQAVVLAQSINARPIPETEEHAWQWTRSAAIATATAIGVVVATTPNNNTLCESSDARGGNPDGEYGAGLDDLMSTPLISVSEVTLAIKPMLDRVRSNYNADQCPVVVVSQVEEEEQEQNEGDISERADDIELEPQTKGIQLQFTSAPLHSALMALTAFQKSAQRADPGCHLQLTYREPQNSNESSVHAGHILHGELVDSCGNGVCQVWLALPGVVPGIFAHRLASFKFAIQTVGDSTMSNKLLIPFVDAYAASIKPTHEVHDPSSLWNAITSEFGAPQLGRMGRPRHEQIEEAESPSSEPQVDTQDEIAELLRSQGATVYLPPPIHDTNTVGSDVSSEVSVEDFDWEMLAGCEHIRTQVEDTVLLTIKYPEMMESLLKRTRADAHRSLNRPRAVLFQGPPGTGKTTTARIISAQAHVPMVYVPIESVMSKYYGEASKRLSLILDTCERLGDCIVFLDEIDSLATSRESGDMHEATRRVLSVLLRKLEGFDSIGHSPSLSSVDGEDVHSKSKMATSPDGGKGSEAGGGRGPRKFVLIGATNRASDLDSALVSRFDVTVDFALPGANARKAILKRYAKQLNEEQLSELAQKSEGFAGRDIKDICEHAERRWVSQHVRQRGLTQPGGERPNGGIVEMNETPPFSLYVEALNSRIANLEVANAGGGGGGGGRARKSGNLL